MSISLDEEEAEELLRALVERTGETPIEAATRAFRERLERLTVERTAVQSRGVISLADLIAEARGSTPVGERGSCVLADELWEDS